MTTSTTNGATKRIAKVRDLADRARAGSLPKGPEDEAVPITPTRRGLSPSDLIATWRNEGAVERLATGWQTFDDASRGGFVLGRLGFLLGAPNAGKTAVAGWLSDRWLREGVAIGALCIDEDASDFLARLAVMAGIPLDVVERRTPATLTAIEEALGHLPLRLYGSEWTIEAAAADLHGWMRARGITRGAFFADSVQTITCDAALDATSLRSYVGANVKALAGVAARHRLAVIATGEIPRAAYDSGRGNDLAAGKESGAIEFAAKVQIVLRRVKKNDALIHVSVPKLKRGTKDETAFFLRFDRASHALTEDDGAAPAAVGASALASARARILELTRTRTDLSTPTKIAAAAGGKRQAVFAAARAMIERRELELVAGTYRPTEATS